MNIKFITDELPERCADCDLSELEVSPDGMYHENFICNATGNSIDSLIYDLDREEYCPLIECKNQLYQRVDPMDGIPLQFVGVYVLRWRPEWGQPTAGFFRLEE